MPHAATLNAGYQITVRGVSSAKRVNNVIMYKLTSLSGVGPTTQDMLEGFEELWKTLICPLLHESYAVALFEIRRVLDVVVIDDAILTRFDQFDSLTGDAGDVGGDAGDAAPTFVASSTSKIVTLGTPRPSGGIRLSPIAESKTSIDPNGQFLDPTYRTSTNNNLVNIMQVAFTDGTEVGNLLMAILRTQNDKIVVPYNPATSLFIVEGMSTSQYASSQVSRKQRRLS